MNQMKIVSLCAKQQLLTDCSVVIIMPPFPHSWLITGFSTRVPRLVTLVEQELLTFTEHSSLPGLLVRFVLLNLVNCISLFVFLSLSHLAIAISIFFLIYGFWLLVWYRLHAAVLDYILSTCVFILSAN